MIVQWDGLLVFAVLFTFFKRFTLHMWNSAMQASFQPQSISGLITTIRFAVKLSRAGLDADTSWYFWWQGSHRLRHRCSCSKVSFTWTGTTRNDTSRWHSRHFGNSVPTFWHRRYSGCRCCYPGCCYCCWQWWKQCWKRCWKQCCMSLYVVVYCFMLWLWLWLLLLLLLLLRCSRCWLSLSSSSFSFVVVFFYFCLLVRLVMVLIRLQWKL